MMFGSDPPAEHPAGGAANASEDHQQQTPVPFSGAAQTNTTFRSHRDIVSMQDSNVAATATGTGAGGSRREPGTDRTTTTTRVSSSAGATPPPFPSRVWSYRAAKASAIGGVSPTTVFSSSQLPRHRMPACVTLSRHRQSSNLQACAPNSCATPPSKRTSIFIYSLSSFLHRCLSRRSSTSTLSTY